MQTGLQIYIHADRHRYIHTYIRTYIHTYIRTYIDTYVEYDFACSGARGKAIIAGAGPAGHWASSGSAGAERGTHSEGFKYTSCTVFCGAITYRGTKHCSAL